MTANLIITIFCCLMIWAAVSDIRYFILSNRLCLSVALLYPIFIAALYFDGFQVTLVSIGWSIGISILIFSFLVFLFARGYIGGGDVKLIPAIALWAGPSLILEFLLITTIFGGLLALLIISFRYLKNYTSQHKSSEKINFSMSELAELDHEENNIPYGVGISIGGLYVAYRLFQALN
ncbi:MAG: prepilin peptidase [Emcibacteraceae bacterium]